MYRRFFQTGGAYFFTVTLKDRRQKLFTLYSSLLFAAIKEAKIKYPFKMIAYVILPEHIHCIWELPENDANYSTRWQLIKSLFTKKLKKGGIQIEFNKKQESNIWARRFWEHVIWDNYDLEKHIDYIHFNPVKHGLVSSPTQWPLSSIHGYIIAVPNFPGFRFASMQQDLSAILNKEISYSVELFMAEWRDLPHINVLMDKLVAVQASLAGESKLEEAGRLTEIIRPLIEAIELYHAIDKSDRRHIADRIAQLDQIQRAIPQRCFSGKMSLE